MPTKIEDIYDALVTVIDATLADYVRFPNPYVINENTFLHMKSGYGIAIGPGRDTERLVGCQLSWERAFTVILVKQMTATQNNTDKRVLIEKEIIADHDALRKAIYSNSTLSGNAIKTTLTSDGGVNFLDGDRLKFLSIEMEVLTEYLESV